MEVFPYILDVVMFAFAVYWSAANYARPPGAPSYGLFRFRETRKGVDPATLEQPKSPLSAKR